MTGFKGKTNLVLPHSGTAKTLEGTAKSPLLPKADETQTKTTGESNKVTQDWNNLVNGRTAQAALNPFLIDATAPKVDSFRGPIYVPHLYRDILSKFPHAKSAQEIPYRAIIVKYDALIRTFRAMVKDLRLIMKGGKIKSSEAPAVHARIEELNHAITKAEAYKQQAENEYDRALRSTPPEPQEA